MSPATASRSLHHGEPAGTAPADARATLYDLLMAQAGGLANDDLFARMLASRMYGAGALPPGLGLAEADFSALMARHFPGFTLPAQWRDADVEAARRAEREELLMLLHEHCSGADVSERWMA